MNTPPAWSVPHPVRGAGDARGALVAHLLLRDGDMCAQCHAPLTGGIRDVSGLGIQIDHIIPRYHGHDEDIANKRLLHAACNNHRGCDLDDSDITQVERNRHYYDVLLCRPDLLDPRCTIWADNDA